MRETLQYRGLNTPEEALHFINSMIDCFKLEPALRDAAEYVLDDPRFHEICSSATKHHRTVGGQLVHTAQVMAGAIQYDCLLEGFRTPELIVACLWHDYGKLWDYSIKRPAEVSYLSAVGHYEWEVSEHKKYIGHLSRSYAEFMVYVSNSRVMGEFDLVEPQPMTEEQADFIGHLILSHHGRQE
jgi:23S rRNA maturation-related 3'-5' exoribonuclease YhaM